MTIGDNIKMIRTDKKLTQQELADKMNISRSYLSDLENNRKSPSMNTVESLAERLDVSVNYLTTGKRTLYDLTDKEKGNQANAEDVSDIDDGLKEHLEEEFKRIQIEELDFKSKIYITEMLQYLEQSNEDDIMRMAAILITLNNPNDKVGIDSLNLEKLKEQINNELKKIEALITKGIPIEEGE